MKNIKSYNTYIKESITDNLEYWEIDQSEIYDINDKSIIIPNYKEVVSEISNILQMYFIIGENFEKSNRMIGFEIGDYDYYFCMDDDNHIYVTLEYNGEHEITYKVEINFDYENLKTVIAILRLKYN